MKTLTSINFLKERVRLQEEVYQSDRRIALISGGVLVVCLGVLIAIVLYGVFLSTQLEKVSTAKATQESLVRSLSEQHQTYQTLREKLQIVRQLLDKRQGKWGAITYFYSLLPEGASISTVSLSPADQSLEMIYRASDVAVFQKLLEAMQNEGIASSGYTLTLGNVTRTRTGDYDVAVNVSVLAKPKPSPSKTAPRGSTP